MKRQRDFNSKGQPKFKKPALQRQNAAVGPSLTKSVMLAPEKKFFDNSSNTDANTTATVVNLNAVGAGDTALLRDGNKILCNSVQFRMRLLNSDTATPTTVRVMIIHDKNSNGTAPTAAQVLEGTPSVVSMKSISNASRFTTLLDKIVVVNNFNASIANEYITDYVKIPKNLQLAAFADGTAAVPISGSLSLIYIGSSISGAADTLVDMTTRTRFVG